MSGKPGGVACEVVFYITTKQNLTFASSLDNLNIVMVIPYITIVIIRNRVQ